MRGFRSSIIGAGGEIAWPQPTRPGDILRVESEILAINPSRSRPDRGMATVRSLTLNQRNEVVQSLIAKLIVPRSQQGENAILDEENTRKQPQ